MLVDSSRSSSIASNSSTSNSNSLIFQDIPSTIVWSQTLESITLKINVNQVQVILTERYLKLSNKSQKITLPLYGTVYIQQADIEQMIDMNSTNNRLDNNIIYLTLEKEFISVWPHLLMQQTDEEVASYLTEANFLLHIYRLPASPKTIVHVDDILDFDTIINGNGQKTGLE